MSHDDREALINDYLDDELTVSDRHRVEHLLRHDTVFAQDVRRQRDLLATVAGLPRGIHPPPGAWEAIASRIDADKVVAGAFRPRRHHPWRTRMALAAAAVALVVITSTVTVVAVRSSDDSVRVQDDPMIVPGGAALAAEYQTTIDMLEAVLDAHRDGLNTETVEIVEASLATIDRAIHDAAAALETDPGNAFVLRQLAGAYRQKVDVLAQVARQAASL